jgi:uncharacterized protein YceK
MFGRTASAGVVAALAAFGGGCGTLINQSNDPGQAFYSDQFPTQMPYGGVLRDLAAPPAGVWQAATAEPDPGVLARSQMIAASVFVPPLDLPFSLVGDTLFLPFDLAHTLGMGQSASSAQAPQAAPPPPPVTTVSKSPSTAAPK